MITNTKTVPTITKRTLLLFITQVIGVAALVWLVSIFLFWAGVGSRDDLRASSLLLPVLAGLFGVFFAVPASLGITYIETVLHTPSITRISLAVMWFLILAVIWWMITSASALLLDPPMVVVLDVLESYRFPIIAFAAVLFYACHSLRRQLVIHRAEWRARRRQEAFRLLPKTHSDYDSFEPEVLHDPRYSQPMPLPLAVSLLHQGVKSYKEADKRTIRISIDQPQTFPEHMVIEPGILVSAVTFAAEYALHHCVHVATIHISYQSFPRPSIRIATNIKAGDLWFTLDAESPAEVAKLNLVRVLNRYVNRGGCFEVVEDASGGMAFTVWTRKVVEDDTSVWRAVEELLGEHVHLLPQSNRSLGANRIYTKGDEVYKVQLLGHPTPKPLTLAEEYQILHRLTGIDGLPHINNYQEYKDFAILSYTKIDGIQVDEYLREFEFSRRVWFRTIAELSGLLNAIHSRGVVHRDLRPDNILIGKDGKVYLIDFDQAVVGTYAARVIDTLGVATSSIPSCISLKHLIMLLGLEEDYESVVSELRVAWKLGAQSDANSPGHDVAYYRWSFGYADFPGERDWYARWDLMRGVLRDLLPGSHVLDLGCNQGLVTIYCMLYGAASVTAVDREPGILAAAQMLADASGVPVKFLQGELDCSEFVSTNIQNQDYDLVIALSVIHWLRNPDAVLRVLSGARALLYEGHRQYSVEMTFLQDLGFDNIKLLGYSERLRPMFFASRF